jgi:hypothetical protein
MNGVDYEQSAPNKIVIEAAVMPMSIRMGGISEC